MSKIKAVFFDLDETLIENKLSVTEVFGRMYTDFSAELGVDNQHAFFSELKQRAQTVWSTMFEKDMTPERQLIECFEYSIAATEAVADARNLSLAQDMLDHFLFLSAANVCFQDNAEAVLRQLTDLGYITGIITNGIEQVQLGKVNKLKVDELTHSVTVSAQARAHKPLKPVFELALQRAGVNADQAIMIGDHPTNDVAGSVRAGMTGVYYNPKQHAIEKAFAELDEKPDHSINTLADVLSLVS